MDQHFDTEENMEKNERLSSSEQYSSFFDDEDGEDEIYAVLGMSDEEDELPHIQECTSHMRYVAVGDDENLRAYSEAKRQVPEESLKDSEAMEEILSYMEQRRSQESPLILNQQDEYQDYSLAKSIFERAEQIAFLPRIDLAFIEYLRKNYPCLEEQDQNSFDALLLVLFAKMHEGDICINLHSLISIYDVLLEWHHQLNTEMFTDASVDFDFAADLFQALPKTTAEMRKLLRRAPAVGTSKKVLPLIYDHSRLYVRRYFMYEKRISDFIEGVNEEHLSLEKDAKLKEALQMLFVDDPTVPDLNWQKVAAAMSTTSKFTVISGGPGTGKTTTVLRILLLLICSNKQSLSIKLCAPTGKAAARMGESISKQLKNPQTVELLEQLAQLFEKSSDSIKASIPEKAETVHRLLSVRPHVAKPNYNAEHHLPCDILVVDECSMLDLALFSHLLAALDNNCHIILLGDKDQLSSVEAGAVLGDLCTALQSRSKKRLRAETVDYLSYMTGYTDQQLLKGRIADNTVLLRFSYRSRDVPEIGQLAARINEATLNDALDDDKKIMTAEALDSLQAYALKRTSHNEALALGMMQSESDSLHEIWSYISTYEKKGKNIYFLRLPNCGDIQNPIMLKKRIAIAQHCVEQGRVDNYAPFLERLASVNFRVPKTDISLCDELFRLMDRYRILCSNHNGLLGDYQFNMLIEQEVRRSYLHDYALHKPRAFFPGQIIIITKNDPVLGLVNGDVGFVAYDSSYRDDADEEEERKLTKLRRMSKYRQSVFTQNLESHLRVFIPSGVEEVNGVHRTKVNVISPILLTNYDLGYAMSIHKSQGSEYDKITMVLSDTPNQVLTRELVYTAITRARKKVDIISVDASLAYALSHSVERESGLASRLKDIRAAARKRQREQEAAL